MQWQGSGSGGPGDNSYTFDISTPDLGGVNFTSADCPSILPVSLISFDAKVNNCIVNLNWRATSETNFKDYEVQYSTDGANFQTISTIPGAIQYNAMNQIILISIIIPTQGKYIIV